jgi:23S rRNA (uracil1939-C5)-methyltransferase
VGGLDIQPLPMIGADSPSRYRNKAQFPVAAGDKAPLTGFFAPRSHRLVPCSDCPLQPAGFAAVLQAVTDWMKTHSVQAYDEARHSGLVRHVYLRQGAVTGQLMVCLVCTSGKLPAVPDLIERVRRAAPTLACLCVNVNPQKTNVILGKEYRTLWGEDFITDTLGGVTLKIAPDAFFQVNRPAADALYAKAKELACLTGRELLWDLYSGAGSIGLSMADACREVVGVEIVPSAVENARENARRNGIHHARFVVGDASTPETLLENAYGPDRAAPDVVVLDPPRKGCSPELLSYLADTVKVGRIVYISCAPDTLARDCALLTSRGYSLSDVTPVNLFPRTGHVESVVCLSRK